MARFNDPGWWEQELPAEPATGVLGDSSPELRRPRTKSEALMIAGIGDPELSLEELEPLLTLVARTIDALPPTERRVIEAYFFERMSLREMAEAELVVNPKTKTPVSATSYQRLLKRAMADLELALQDDPLVIERLK